MFDSPTYARPQPIERAVPTASAKPTASGEALAIYRYLPPMLLDSELLVPQHLDYRVATASRLYSQDKFMYGEKTHVSYWGEYDPAENRFADLVVSERHVYERDAENYALRRDITITWWRNDGTPHPETKLRTKFYDRKGQITELKKRRANIIDWLRGVFVGTPLDEPVREVLTFLSGEVLDYSETGSNWLRERIGEIDRPWLDTPMPTDPRFTFRQYLPVELAKGMVTSHVK